MAESDKTRWHHLLTDEWVDRVARRFAPHVQRDLTDRGAAFTAEHVPSLEVVDQRTGDAA